MEQAGSQSGSVKTIDASLRYSVEGAGIPLLVIGSATYYPRTFSRQLREVCRVAFADLRHFVERDPACSLDRFTFDGYADDIEQIRATLGFERVAVVGHSHHGNIALEYAKRHPERVSHLVLIGSPPVGVKRTVEASENYWAANATEERKAALRRNLDELRSSGKLTSRSPNEAFVAQYVADGPKYWFDAHYDASALWQDMHINMNAISSLRGLFTEYELSWGSAQLEAPVLVMMGRYDYAVPHVLWDEVLPKLRNTTYHLFERSGHTPQLEEQRLFDRTLLDWLNRTSCVGAM